MNGNGDRRAPVTKFDGRYNFSVKAASTWLSLIVAFVTLTGSVFVAARAGVRSAVKSEVSNQAANPQSPLTQLVVREIYRHEREVCEPRWEEIRMRLRVIENQQASIDAKLDILLDHYAELP